MTFGERLGELRQLAGMTQETLSEKSGVPTWTLRKYEQGQRTRVPFSAVVALAKALGVDCTAFAECSDIIHGDDAETSPVPKPVPMGKRK